MKGDEPRSAAAEVTIDHSQFPDMVRRDLLKSFRKREINHKFHYDTYKQAAKWLAVHEAHSPARTDRRCIATYDVAFRSTAERVRSRAIQVVGVGCGGGQKDVRLLKLLSRPGRVLSYVPCDVSLALALEAHSAAMAVVSQPNIRPMVFDLAAAKDLARKLPKAPGQRLVTFFGMIPNFEPKLILPRLRDLIGRDDLLLFGANLVPTPSEEAMRRILPQYDNSETLDWLMTLLYDAGVEPGDGRAEFSIEKVSGRPPLFRFVARFAFKRARNLRLAGERFAFRRGDALRLFFSYRYAPESLSAWLERHGIKIVEQWITESREEGVFLCVPGH